MPTTRILWWNAPIKAFVTANPENASALQTMKVLPVSVPHAPTDAAMRACASHKSKWPPRRTENTLLLGMLRSKWAVFVTWDEEDLTAPYVSFHIRGPNVLYHASLFVVNGYLALIECW
jgi:hypothetical protein